MKSGLPGGRPEDSSWPLVTVVIPAYNREWCLGEAIESALAQQTDFGYEVIVVDDGSTDRTGEIARSYGYPVRVISKENGGPSSARNAGVLAARSELIAFLDSDDLMLPGRLARQAEFLLAHPEVVLAFGDIVLDEHPAGSYLKTCNLPFVKDQWLMVDDPYRRLLTQGNFVSNQTTMLRKEHFVRAGMMDESLWVSEDYELWSRMSLMGKLAYYCAPFARIRRNVGDSLMYSDFARMDMARARHMMLVRDRILDHRERQQSIALMRIFLRQLLRYDLVERGRRQMLKDLREIGSWFGPWYFFRWWVVSLIPRPLVRLVSRLRREKLGWHGGQLASPGRRRRR